LYFSIYDSFLADKQFFALLVSITAQRAPFHKRLDIFNLHARFFQVLNHTTCLDFLFLSVQDNVDPEKIGIIGICGWGGMALNATAIDTRIKATVASTMYNMTRVNAKGYFDSADSVEARHQARVSLNAQRILEYKNGSYTRGGGVIDPLPEDAPHFVKVKRHTPVISVRMHLPALRVITRK